ncbi:MAG: pyridoxal phosphate-dependent aminotransferase [Peptococcaceae bacterium]|jgi:cystathionine beta-lyase|nr:pyridoxal phosphate-dependent aminotransferase [Peptococcaceae bacterium]NMA43643.1 pyridoxal phosphate-dependent aminotransferase [Oligosphaeraceae bacterium]
MKYDFDTVIDRRNTNSLKYDFTRERGLPEDVLPLWVADMDFPAPPEVLAAMQKAVSHGIFGYSEVKDAYYEALTSWFAARFGYTFTARDVVKTPGIVFALAAAVRAFTKPGDSVLIQTPVYYPFYTVICDNGRKLVTNPLRYESGAYSMDFEDFEHKIKSENVKLFILCSPHNPVGRVWTRRELDTLHAICKKYKVLVLSDEIHCDFVYPGHKHTTFGLIDENAVIATAPSKTFNLAGLQVSNIIVPNKTLRHALKEEIAKGGYNQLNTLGLVACQSAYSHGGIWLEQLKEYLAENIRLTRIFLAERLPKVRLVDPQGTYLLWLDFSKYGLSQKELDKRIIEDAKLWLSSGTTFGSEGEGFQRINIACPKLTLQKALERLAKAFS